MADTPTTQREEDQQNQPQTWALDPWASALSAPSQNPEFLAQAKAAYDAQHDVSWDERVATERAELTERAERMTRGHAGRIAREALAEFNPEAELGAWAMENTLQNTPEFLDAAKADYDSIHGAGAWDAHVEATHQELKEEADGWDLFGFDERRLENFDPNQMLADWGRTHILSQQSALDWSNAAAFGLDGDVFKGLDGQNPVPDETMYDQSTEFGQAWLNASEILYNAKNDQTWAERVAEEGWDEDRAAQELAEEGESYVSWFENNLASAAQGSLNLSEDGQVAMVYLMSLNGFTESTWGDLGGALWRGAADPTFIAATAAGALTFGAGGVAAHGGRIAAQQGIMHGIKQIMISRTASAAAVRGATAALGEGLASGAALESAEQKLAVDNDIREGYDTGAIFVRSVTEGVASAGFGGVLSGGGRFVATRVDFSSVSGKISNFIGSKNGDVSADFQRFQTLTREASEAKEAGDTAALQNIGDGYDALLRDGKLSADERTLVESELAGIHAAANPARQSGAPDADAAADANAPAAPTPDARNSTASEEPEIPVVTDVVPESAAPTPDARNSTASEEPEIPIVTDVVPESAAPTPEARNITTEEPEIPVVTETAAPRPNTRIATPGPRTETPGPRQRPETETPKTRTATPEQQRANLDAMAEQRAHAESMSSQERQAAATPQQQQNTNSGKDGNSEDNASTPPSPASAEPPSSQPATPRKPNGWNKGTLSEQEKAAFITSIDDTTARNAFINKLSPVERNTLMSQLPDGDILGYVNTMSDVNARSRLIQNLPAGKRDDVLDALNVSSRLDGGQPEPRTATPNGQDQGSSTTNKATDADPAANKTSNDQDSAADTEAPKETEKPSANTQKRIGFLEAVSNSQNEFRGRWKEQVVNPEIESLIAAGKLKKPGILNKNRDELPAAEQKAYDKAEKQYDASIEKVSEGLERKYDYNKLVKAYRSIADARHSPNLNNVDEKIKAAWTDNITGALQAAVDNGWHPDQVTRLIVHSRVAGLGDSVKKFISDRDNGESLYNLTRSLPEGSYGRDLFDKIIEPLIQVKGADGVDGDTFLLKLDTGRKPYGDDLESHYTDTWRAATNLKDIAKSFIPLSFNANTSIGQVARSGDPMTRVFKENFFKGMRGMHIGEDGTNSFGFGRLLNNWTINAPSLGIWNYANNVSTGTYRMGIKGAALALALGNAYVGEELITEPLMGEDLTIMGQQVDLARRAIQDPVDIADYTIGNIWAGFSDDKEMNFSHGPDYVTANWAHALGDADSANSGIETQPNTVPHLPYRDNGSAPSANNAPAAQNDSGSADNNDAAMTGNNDGTPPSGAIGGATSQTQTTTTETESTTSATTSAADINIKEHLPVTVQKLMTRENKEQMGQLASQAGGFFSGLATGAMGIFRNLNNMLGPTWGPVAGVIGAVLGGMIGFNILKSAKNFLTGGGIMKLGGMAVLGAVGLYAFEHFSGARDAHNNEADTDARLRNTGPITTTSEPNTEHGRTSLIKDDSFRYKGAFDAMQTSSLSETCVGQGSCENLPHNIEVVAQQPETLALTKVANVSFNGKPISGANDFEINDDFRATPHDSGIANTYALTTDATGTHGIFNASEMALAGMNGAAEQGYTFTAAQNGLGFNGAELAGGTFAATGNNHLPNEFSAMMGSPASIRFDNTGHDKGQAIAANGWKTDEFTPRNNAAIENAPHEEQPVSFNSLA